MTCNHTNFILCKGDCATSYRHTEHCKACGEATLIKPTNHYENINRLIAKATHLGQEEAGIVEECVNLYVEAQIRIAKAKK